MVSKSRYEYSFSEGNKAEEKFKELMNSRGNICLKSTKDEDMHRHIDFWVNEVPVDVKGNRHLECIWLEIKNVHGNKGWLHGDSFYIVFDVVELKSFCFFRTEKLLNWVKKITKTAKDKTEFNALYTRKDRKDVLVKVRYNEIKHLESFKIKY